MLKEYFGREKLTLALYFGRLNWVEYGVFSPSALPNDKLQVAAAAAAVQALTARVWGGNTKGVLAPKYLILLIKYIHTYIYSRCCLRRRYSRDSGCRSARVRVTPSQGQQVPQHTQREAKRKVEALSGHSANILAGLLRAALDTVSR